MTARVQPWVSVRALGGATRTHPLVVHEWGRPWFTRCGQDLDHYTQLVRPMANVLIGSGLARSCRACAAAASPDPESETP